MLSGVSKQFANDVNFVLEKMENNTLVRSSLGGSFVSELFSFAVITGEDATDMQILFSLERYQE